MDLSMYLVADGPVINDGDTVGGDDQQRIVGRHAPSFVGRPGPVYRLE